MTARSEPKFGNCEDCAAWSAHDLGNGRHCQRRAPAVALAIEGLWMEAAWPRTRPHHGCFDHIPKRETTHAG